MCPKEFHQEMGSFNVAENVTKAEEEFCGTKVRFIGEHPCAGKVGIVERIVQTELGRRPFVRFEDFSWAVVMQSGDSEVVGLDFS